MGDSSESPFTLRKKRVNLRGYYQSLEPSTPNEKQKDKASEDEQESLQHILKTQSLDQLLQTDINLRKEIKELDDNMKLLVFDNYNKFITAETTIRQMREKVDTMEDEMTKLSSKIERISENSEEINESLQSKKKQIDVLVGVHKLLQKLQFLVDLPRKLKTAVDNENYRDAVNYYKVTYSVLDKYKHIPSFQPISQQCIQIVTDLEKTLQQKFFNEEESMDTIITYGNLLHDLKHSSNERDISSRIIGKFINRVLKMFDTTFDETFDHQVRVLSGYFADIFPLFIKLCQQYESNEEKEILESLKQYQCPNSLIESLSLMKNDNSRRNQSYYEKIFIFSLLDLHFEHIKKAFEGLIKDDINAFSKENFITSDILEEYNPGKYTSLLLDNIVKLKILTRICNISESDFLDALPERFGSLFEFISDIFTNLNENDLKSKGCLIYMLLSPSIFGKFIEFIKIESQEIPSLIGYGNIIHPIRKRLGTYENHLIDSSVKVITQFVHLNSSIIGQMFQKSIEGKDWINMPEPQFINNSTITIVNEIISLEKIITTTLTYWREKGLITFITKDKKGHSRKESHSETRFNNFLQRKIDYFQDFELNPKDIFVSIVKRSFKTLLEMLRLNTFSMHGYQQIQVDMYYLKRELSNVFVDSNLLELIVDEILTTAKERCIEPKPFEESILENIYESMEI